MNFKFPIIVSVLSLLAASSLGACGSDSSNAPATGVGACNNNGVAEPSELCDGMDVKQTTCAQLMMNAMATGQVACANCQLVATGCTVPGGAGGSTGTGGGTGTGGR